METALKSYSESNRQRLLATLARQYAEQQAILSGWDECMAEKLNDEMSLKEHYERLAYANLSE